jgi:hypothetical protein
LERKIKEEVDAGRKLLVIGNSVVDIDIGNFHTGHPGGQVILSMVGKDPETVKKVMQNRHRHTKAARNQMENLTIAYYQE